MEFKVGDSFNSFKELEEKIEAYENESYVSLYRRNSRTIGAAQKSGIKRKMNDELIYYTIRYACCHGGRFFKSQSTGKRPNQSTYKMDCPFGLWLKASDNGDQLRIEKIVTVHNHIVNKIMFEQLPKKRKLNADEEKEASRLLGIHGNKSLIKEHLFKATGKRVTLRDLHNIAAKQKKSIAAKQEESISAKQEESIAVKQEESVVVKQEESVVVKQEESMVVKQEESIALMQEESVDLESLLAVCCGCNGPDLELKKADKGIVTGMFYQDSEMKHLFGLYPELLIMDATYQLTHLGMTLYIMLVIGPNGDSEIVAFFLTASDDLTMLSNMLEIFKSKNKNWDKILTIFTDKVMAERCIIQQAFPQAQLLLCIFHILRSMKKEITTSKLNITEEQRLSALKALQKMLYSNSKKEYEQLHDSFLNTMPESVVQYVEENWHKWRREWVQCWQPHNVTYEEVTTKKLESVNRRIKSIVSLLSPLPVFFSNLLSVIICMLQEGTHAYINTTECLPISANGYSLTECQYRETLTPFAFSFVERQFDLAKTVETLLLNGILVSHIAGRTEKLDNNNCVCLFFKSLNLPCKHIFAARITNQTSMYSLVGIAARWLKQHVLENEMIFQSIHEQDGHIKAAEVNNRPLTKKEEFHHATRLSQHLAELAAKGKRSQCEKRVKVLEDLVQVWDSNQEAMIIPVECSSNTITEVTVSEDNLTAVADNFTAVDDNGACNVQENKKHDPNCQSRQIKIKLYNKLRAATISKEKNQLDSSKPQFSLKRRFRSCPKNNTEKNALGL